MLSDALSGLELSGITGGLTRARTVFGLKVIDHLTDGKAALGKSLGLRALEPDDKAPKMSSWSFLSVLLLICLTSHIIPLVVSYLVR